MFHLVHLRREWIDHYWLDIYAWAQYIVFSPLNLTRIFLTHQLIYKSKIENHNISSDILVSDTSVV